MEWHGIPLKLPPRPPWHGMEHATVFRSVCLSVCQCGVDRQTVAVGWQLDWQLWLVDATMLSTDAER
jgi:hypothetical protein